MLIRCHGCFVCQDPNSSVVHNNATTTIQQTLSVEFDNSDKSAILPRSLAPPNLIFLISRLHSIYFFSILIKDEFPLILTLIFISYNNVSLTNRHGPIIPVAEIVSGMLPCARIAVQKF